jgi:hypothetical protein
MQLTDAPPLQNHSRKPFCVHIKDVFIAASDFADEKVSYAKYGHYRYQPLSLWMYCQHTIISVKSGCDCCQHFTLCVCCELTVMEQAICQILMDTGDADMT